MCREQHGLGSTWEEVEGRSASAAVGTAERTDSLRHAGEREETERGEEKKKLFPVHCIRSHVAMGCGEPHPFYLQ